MPLSSFPHLTPPEFTSAISHLATTFSSHQNPTPNQQNDWLSVHVLHDHDTQYLRITKSLPSSHGTNMLEDVNDAPESDELELVEENDDDEVLNIKSEGRGREPVVIYDIFLSPTYRVPVLYIYIQDPLFRYPITSHTLYNVIIPPGYRDQVQNTGVMGGVTGTDHPVSNSPVWFVHPCKTAAGLEGVVHGGRELEGWEYLVLWLGLVGGFVGLGVPRGLVVGGEEGV